MTRMTKTTKRAWRLAAMTVLGAALAMGCSGNTGSPSSSTRPSASSLSEGLTVFEARAEWGMNAAYVKSGTVVYLETRVGPATPQALRTLDPSAPLHEVDVRYVDELGNSFNVQRGGDTFIDPTWGDEIAKQIPVSPAHRALAFQLAREAGQATQGALGAEMGEHLEAALRIGSHVPSEDPMLIDEAARIPKTESAYTSYTHYAKVYSKCLATCLAEHSAVYAIEWNGSAWDWSMTTCNHGTCAAASGMTYDCETSRGGRTNQMSGYFSGEKSGSTGTVSGACSTSYNWLTNGSDHNCNDDSWYEDWQVVNNKTGNRGSQNGNDNSGYAYSCGGGHDDSGDNTHPDCL